MSIIRCPRCQGHVSTMAGTCPTCGVQIVDNLTECPYCGAYVLKTDTECYACGHPIAEAVETVSEMPNQEENFIVLSDEGEGEVTSLETEEEVAVLPFDGADPEQPKRRYCWKTRYTAMLVSFVLLCVAAGGTYWYITRKQADAKEQASYEKVMHVTDPALCEDFLNKYPKSPHRAVVEERLQLLQSESTDWQQLCANPTREAISHYLARHSNTIHANECERLSDSLDWAYALELTTEQALTDYIDNHPTGKYYELATAIRERVRKCSVTSSDVMKARSTIINFFNKAFIDMSEVEVNELLCDTAFTFCQTPKATARKVLSHKLAQRETDVSSKSFVLLGDPTVAKEIQENGNLYWIIDCQVRENLHRADPTKPYSKTYLVSATLTQGLRFVNIEIDEEE